MVAEYRQEYIKCIYLNKESAFKLAWNLNVCDITRYYTDDIKKIKTPEALDLFIADLHERGLIHKINIEKYEGSIREDNTYCISFNKDGNIVVERELEVKDKKMKNEFVEYKTVKGDCIFLRYNNINGFTYLKSENRFVIIFNDGNFVNIDICSGEADKLTQILKNGMQKNN